MPKKKAEAPVTESAEQPEKKKTAKKAKAADARDEGQPVLNIGLVGHVDHGKTTLTERFTGKWTDTHSEEMKRGITIRLGYADVVIRKCGKCGAHTVKEKCDCGGSGAFVRKVSFVDAPGHESLMATMLAGSTIMDGALLLIAANEECPQPQTREHLMALEIMGLKKVIVVQNKVDLAKEDQALKNYEQIKKFLKGTTYEHAPIVPISARYNANTDVLLQAIEEHIPTPERDASKEPIMYVARSFDINKPGTKPAQLCGGVLGGTLVQGKLRAGDEIEIRPGRKIEKQNQISYEPLRSTIADLKTGGASTPEVVPGGSIGVLTKLDPGIVKADALVGSGVGHAGKLPPTLSKFALEVHLLDRVVGSKEDLKVEVLKIGEPLMLNVNAAATVGVVTELKKGRVYCTLKLPVCAAIGSRVTISRRFTNRFRLIGYGIIADEKK